MKFIDGVNWEAIFIVILVGLFPLFIISRNWYIFWLIHIKKTESPNWTPILGGMLVFLALLALGKPYYYWCWLAFVIDYGCLPGIIESVIYYRQNEREYWRKHGKQIDRIEK